MVARGLAPMTAVGFLKDLTLEVERDVINHVVGVPRLRVVTDESLSPLAFLASEVVKATVFHPDYVNLYHLGGIIIDGMAQNKKMGEALLRDELAQTLATHLGFHTQNAHMLRLGDLTASHDLSLSSALAKEMGTKKPEYMLINDQSHVVDVGRYPAGGLYGDQMEFKKRRMQIPQLNTNNGDAVVFVGRVK